MHRTFSVFGDLSLVDVASGDVRRLTRGVRAYDPDVSPDGRSDRLRAQAGGPLGAVHGRPSTAAGSRRSPRPWPGVEWSGPRWSPDGDAIVGRAPAARRLARPRARRRRPRAPSSSSPTTGRRTSSPRGRRTARRSSSAPTATASRTCTRCAWPTGRSSASRTSSAGAFQPSVSPDGALGRLLDLLLARLRRRRRPARPRLRRPRRRPSWTRIPAPRPDPLPGRPPVQPYRPGSMLLPRFWTPWVRDRATTRTASALATGGSDALFRHVWAARATYGTESRARQRERLLPVRPLPADLPRERAGHDRRLHAQRADLRGPGRSTCRPRCRCAAPCARSRRSPPPGGASARRCWAATARRTASTSAASRRPGRSLGALVPLLDLADATAAGCASPGCTRRRRSAATLSLDKLTRGRAATTGALFGERDVLALRAGARHDLRRAAVRAVVRRGRLPGRAASSTSCARTTRVLRGYPDNAFTGRRYAAVNAEYRFPLFSPAARLALVPALPPPLPRLGLLRRRERLVGGVPGRDVKTRGRRVDRPRQRDRLRPAAHGRGHPRPRLRRAGRHEGLLPLRAGVLAEPAPVASATAVAGYRPFESFRYLSSSESVERMTVASLSSAVCSVSIDFQNS